MPCGNVCWIAPTSLVTSSATLSGFAAVASASPGAHGPNGEHLDTNQTGSAAVSTAPQLDAKSELFELVARLDGGELSILIDNFATNEPVLKADVEVESGSLKAKARFHADLGDYAVDDPAMLKLHNAMTYLADYAHLMGDQDNGQPKSSVDVPQQAQD